MFLDATLKYNKKLIKTSLDLHQKGIISPNTYVLDLDTVQRNAVFLSREAKKQDIELLFMTKQFGRNELVAKAIVEAGIEKAVAVDPWEALVLHKHGIKIGHVGHLVQIPKNMIREILALHPDYVTVFSYENAENISEAALQMNRKQKIFLRVADKGDCIYNGQEGGFTLEQLTKDIGRLKDLKGVELAGLTSFPCILIEKNKPRVTPNVETMQKAKSLLQDKGITDLVMNMPSATSTATMKLLKENGATQAEPGHALTGTTPLHASGEHPEKPAMVYVSEVSHVYNHKAYVFGGGFYPRSRMKGALVGAKNSRLRKVPVIQNDPSNIDYYGTLDTDYVHVGDTVIYAFRTQVFVTNAQIAILKDISTDPKILGIYDAGGNLLKR
ncbi:YhfX family PLP-dependent enzyme [Virgibacillus sp. 179-BFC.A HS]|uniref:YhfX family PLP-dependent enzyme n=1 Tax=Tigheibacillus jepli TaxID=3035914 RepID=A0ABU5CES5_9BACI|nr:YhfX family PLP-dependent enzyme [Virgibacillus sp. 179-BFC.A HS]MDY0404791.1 YhfX family PLP-dependent enzyme [Virgibacillus sp. 179-BFC.A HS]